MKHVLHCPQATVNLLSINRFYIENDCYFVLTRSKFFVKDNLTRRTLVTSKSEGRLYFIQVDRQSINKFRPSVALMGVHTIPLMFGMQDWVIRPHISLNLS